MDGLIGDTDMINLTTIDITFITLAVEIMLFVLAQIKAVR